MTLKGCSVRASTRRTNAAFFDLLLGGLEDLDRHLLAPEHPLQFADALLRRAELARRHDILVGRHRGLTALRE
jgi:hypothetical protein